MTKEQSHALMMADSQHRAAVLADVCDALDGNELREALKQWTICDGARSHWPRLLDHFRRAGFVSDVEGADVIEDCDVTIDGEGDISIYRGNLGEDPAEGFSWTTDVETAQRFAVAPFSLRHQILGIGASRADGEEPLATVWGAWIPAWAVYGYFNGRGEQELIVEPDELQYVKLLGQATETPERTGSGE